MKKIFLLICIFTLISACNQPLEKSSSNLNEDYSKNLVTAQKFFELFLTEDIEAQKPLICPGVTHYPPFYGSEPGKYDAFMAAGKAWMDNFDEIMGVFKQYGDLFPHIRGDKMTTMIEGGNVVWEDKVLITYNHYKRKQKLSYKKIIRIDP